jgi:hypothetical protein
LDGTSYLQPATSHKNFQIDRQIFVYNSFVLLAYLTPLPMEGAPMENTPAAPTTRIKAKFGDFEFDADGPVPTVESQFDAFMKLVSSMPHKSLTSDPGSPKDVIDKKDDPDTLPHIPIEKILHVSGRVVSLTAIPKSATDAALLIMLGQKDLRNNSAVTGQEIGDGLAQSGREVPRVDRVMDQALADQHVLKTGVKRGTRYRLTNMGLSKALGIAKELIESLP